MTTLLLAVLGWCLVSFVATSALAAVCAGARKGAAANGPAWQRPVVLGAAPLHVPAPRAALADAPLAV